VTRGAGFKVLPLNNISERNSYLSDLSKTGSKKVAICAEKIEKSD